MNEQLFTNYRRWLSSAEEIYTAYYFEKGVSIGVTAAGFPAVKTMKGIVQFSSPEAAFKYFKSKIK